ncbi:MAG: hypothetical protein OXT68_08875 [Chloroflexota bacterium]|nr:hypothetical protein [Chloroflexota bacterium]
MKTKTILLVGLMMLFSACNARISSEIYLVDIDEVADIGDIATKVKIGLPISSQDECDEKRQEYEAMFSKSTGFKGMEFVRCYVDGYNDFAEYELDVPIRMVDPYQTSMEGVFEIIRHDDSATNNRHMYVRSNPSLLCNLDKIMREDTYRSLDLSDTSPLITVSNDFREPQTLILNQVFVNGSPLIEPTEIVLDRRDSISITLSDVTSAWIFNKSCSINSRTALVGIWAQGD